MCHRCPGDVRRRPGRVLPASTASSTSRCTRTRGGCWRPSPTLSRPEGKLVSIPGHPPRLNELPPGCRFAPRCPEAFERCRVEAAGSPRGSAGTLGRHVTCMSGGAPDARRLTPRSRPCVGQDDCILEVEGLRKYFPLPRGLLGTLRNLPRRAVHAVDGVSFKLGRGEILALVGESGCGKTTTAMTLMGLVEANAGPIRFNGAGRDPSGRAPARKRHAPRSPRSTAKPTEGSRRSSRPSP